MRITTLSESDETQKNEYKEANQGRNNNTTCLFRNRNLEPDIVMMKHTGIWRKQSLGDS